MRSRSGKFRPERLRMGTRVRYRYPAATIKAEVIEDRGFIRQGGEQMVRIRAAEEIGFPTECGTPVRRLEVVHPSAERAA